MKTLIVYATKHGCTETCAKKVANGLDGETTISNLKKDGKVNLEAYDVVVIGGSIHAGRVQRVVRTFCEKNQSILLGKKVGLFLCCMEEGVNAEKQFSDAFPENLRNHANATGMFGGAFNFERMNAGERFIIKRIAKIEQSVTKISDEAIQSFISKMNAC